MPRMVQLELVGILLLACTPILTEHREFYGGRGQFGYRGAHHSARTREIRIKYGRLRGTVVQPRAADLQLVDVFLGVPYAEPPVGQHRFEPPTTQTPWTGVRHFINFGPVCPQNLPNTEEEVDSARYQYLKRLLPFLQNQSEDCLYLNIYAPHQNNSQRSSPERYPVVVFIHGESYEWNSGNPYDGSVLAAYGNVVFVTVNFRLGILGFLRPGTKDDTASNFGLLDQIAALAWLKDNVEQFGGDPGSVTLLGHGTGAVFVNLLLLSPMDGLFKRAILMSGSALNPDAIGKAPLQITKQVAYALNCPQISEEELAACLKNRSVGDLLAVKIHKPKYVPAFAPLVDSAVIPDKPANLMKNAARLARFDLLYGATELERFHALPGVALLEGLSGPARDEFIRDSVKASHELEPDLILRRVLEHYGNRTDRRGRRRRRQEDPEANRDLALEVSSDSGVLAPLVATANLHSRANPKSYMYIFTHPRSLRDKSAQGFHRIRQTVHGEELPYVLGVPLDGEGYHLSAAYDKGEALLSKAMMDWWCNFAYSGNPNNVRPPPRRLSHLQEFSRPSSPYGIEWPEYDPENQTYFNLTTPPQVGQHYRAAEMEFWNEMIPRLLRRPKPDVSGGTNSTTTKRPRPGLQDLLGLLDQDVAVSPANVRENATGSAPSNLGDGGRSENHVEATGADAEEADEEGEEGRGSEDGGGSGGPLRNPSAISLVIGFGVVFLLINASALVYLYHKRQRMRKKATGAAGALGGGLPAQGHEPEPPLATAVSSARKTRGKASEPRLGYCTSTSRPDIREIIKNDKAYDNNSNFGRRSRDNNSSSTIDTKIKVREWIQQEIVHRCSPRFLRKTRETLQREHREKLMKQRREEEDEEEEEDAAPEEHEEKQEQVRVRAEPRVRPAKVSVGVDATPGARTESILGQVPIELARGACYEDAATVLGASEYCEPTDFRLEEVHMEEVRGRPNVVVIEHHHSRSDPLPMDKIPNHSGSKAISTAARINESDSGSASSLYAKINPRMKSRLPMHQQIQQKHLQQEPAVEVEVRGQATVGPTSTLPRLLTFVSPDVNVTSREVEMPTTATSGSESSCHEEALRTIRRRKYPKVLPDIEKRRSLPPNASFVVGPRLGQRQVLPATPPSPPPRIYGTSRSLDCVEDRLEEEEEEAATEEESRSILPVTTNLHVGPLRRRTDSPRNQSVPSLVQERPRQACPVHGSHIPGARSEPRIVISPRIDEVQQSASSEGLQGPVDQVDCPRRLIPERTAKLPRIIIKPTTSTLPRSQSMSRSGQAVVTPGAGGLDNNETYQRLLARRERMPLPSEARLERAEVVQRVGEAAITKL